MLDEKDWEIIEHITKKEDGKIKEIQKGTTIKFEGELTMRKLMLLYLKNCIPIDIPISVMGADVSYITYENGNIILDEVDPLENQ